MFIKVLFECSTACLKFQFNLKDKYINMLQVLKVQKKVHESHLLCCLLAVDFSAVVATSIIGFLYVFSEIF